MRYGPEKNGVNLHCFTDLAQAEFIYPGQILRTSLWEKTPYFSTKFPFPAKILLFSLLCSNGLEFWWFHKN